MRRTVSPLLAMALAGCGVAAESGEPDAAPSSVAAVATAEVPAPGGSVESSSASSSIDLVDAGSRRCDLGDVRAGYDAIVVADAVEFGDVFETGTGRVLPTLRWSGEPRVLVRLERDPDVSAMPESGQPFDTVIISPELGFTDADAISAVLLVDDPVLFVSSAPSTSGGLVRSLIAAGSMEPDGSISLLGSCGATWSEAISTVAHRQGSLAGPEFYARLADTDDPLSMEVSDAFFSDESSPDERWASSDPADRSLDHRDIPRAHLEEFSLTGLNVVLDGAVPDGYVIVRSSEGVMATLAVPAVSGVVPIMVPNAESLVDVLFAQDPSSPDAATLLAEVAGQDLDIAAGVELTIVADRAGGLDARLVSMAPGQLEMLLGTSGEGIDELRASLLAARAD